MSEEFVFDAFGYFAPVKRAKDRSDVTRFRSVNNSMGKTVLNRLEVGNLRLRL